MPSSIDDFEAIMQGTADGVPCHILLGNGFTIGAGVTDFNDQALFGQTREFLRRNKQRPELAVEIGRFGSGNVESILGKLRDGGTPEGDLQLVREGFIWSIEQLHPPGWTALDRVNVCNASHFLKRFDSIFTTNYDRLLYWTINHTSDCVTCGSAWFFSDGFRRYTKGPPRCESLCFRGSFPSHLKRVFQLHGALHYFDESGHVHKRQAGRYDDLSPYETQQFEVLKESVGFNIDDPLSYRLFLALQAGRFPIFVAEGDAKSKSERIRSNRYLREALKALSSITGHLFIHGSAVREEDLHLWLAISGNLRIRSVNVSVFEGDSGTVQRASQFLTAQGNRRLNFYDAETARIWHP